MNFVSETTRAVNAHASFTQFNRGTNTGPPKTGVKNGETQPRSA